MKKVANILFIITSAIILSSSYMQAQDAAVFQIRGGMTLSNVTVHDDGDIDNATPKVGYNIGALVDFRIGNQMYIETGLMLTSKGAKVDIWEYGYGNS